MDSRQEMYSAVNNKIQVRFPPGHAIWQLPAGQRAAKVREAVDAHERFRQVERALNEIMPILNEIMLMVADIDGRLKLIEKRLSGNGNDGNQTENNSDSVLAPIEAFDIDGFEKL